MVVFPYPPFDEVSSTPFAAFERFGRGASDGSVAFVSGFPAVSLTPLDLRTAVFISGPQHFPLGRG